MKLINYLSITIQNKIFGICKKFDISILYQSKVGIKSTNQLISSDALKFFQTESRCNIDGKSLHIGFDGLKDEFTLINRKIMDSPHFELMDLLCNNKDIMESEYIKRTLSGTLDFRFRRKIDKQYLDHIHEKFEQKLLLIKLDEYEPVKVINVNGQYFIIDGKHTAALCSYLEIAPKCVEIEYVTHDSFWMWIYRKMLKHKNSYKKNIEFYTKICNSNDHVT